jgi:16S rRNA (cytosine1402-N4)-methyltransferase
VLVDAVVNAFAAVPSGLIVDATVGGAGHAVALLEARSDLRIVGVDRDADAIAAARGRLVSFGERATFQRARFDLIGDVARDVAARSDAPVVGVLFDLGVSSPQLDRPERGFSYRNDAPLDMRMDRSQATTAADVVNTYSEGDLARVLHRYGDERYARRIAKAIVAARPISSTTALAEIVRAAIPAAARRQGGHPARRTFQAIRIEVNDELAVLQVALGEAFAVLAPGGRCAVISYHSGEDRIVKTAFREAVTGGCTCPPGLPCVCGARPIARYVGRRVLRPSPDEVARNRRAESARLRIVEKLGDAGD